MIEERELGFVHVEPIRQKSDAEKHLEKLRFILGLVRSGRTDKHGPRKPQARS